ncbi:MAG: RbsD/FucU family protein [Micromonosporaceae bacterium]
MLKTRLIHPEILTALAEAGHGARLLIADGNYPYSTGLGDATPLVYLNLAPGLVTVEQVLDVLLDAIEVEAAAVMIPDPDAPTPQIHTRFREMLPDGVATDGLSRQDFYDAARADDVVLAIATGEQRTYANLLLTIGVA